MCAMSIESELCPLLLSFSIRYAAIGRQTKRMQTSRTRRNHLYTLRRIRGFRQKQLARLLGYRATAMISRFETGASYPPLKVALLMEIVLGTKLSEIYLDDYRELEQLVLKRCRPLPEGLTRQIRGRLLRKE